jgi:hypothetical protein
VSFFKFHLAVWQNIAFIGINYIVIKSQVEITSRTEVRMWKTPRDARLSAASHGKSSVNGIALSSLAPAAREDSFYFNTP